MATLRDEALNYMPKQTLNVTDLPELPVDAEMFDREGVDGEGKPFKYKAVSFNGNDYRVPGTVIGDIKQLLSAKPDLKKVKVAKKGTGLNTRYTVIPM